MAGGASEDDEGLISGINVTPLVDVMLVLLVIFMVTAKIIVQQGMPMDLPKSASGEAMQSIFSVDLSADGRVRVDSKPVADDEGILPLAKKAKKETKEVRAVIRADKKVEHGRVIHVLDLLRQAGVAKIAFAVSPSAPKGDTVDVQPGSPPK
ncbi:MAG TPA: biopolymer transporter ExbD [Polyangiaceae bacterium]